MITEKNIRKIPKYMLKLIKKADEIENPKPNGKTRFYSYLTKYKNELARVTVAVRNKYKKWYCKQVVVRGIHNNKVYLRDIGLVMGFYKVGWYRENLTTYPKWYDYDWGYNDDKYFNIHCPIINKDFIKTLPEYKYSAIEQYYYNDIIQYLRVYEKYPLVELLVKGGLSSLATSKMILNKCNKDRNFAKWLIKNKEDVKLSGYTSSIIKAYTKNKSVKETYNFDKFLKYFNKPDNFTKLKQMLKANEKTKFIEYLIKQNVDGYSYLDYLNACEYLGLDMNENKNRYPHDFKFWHDTRIDEYHSLKAIKDEQERKSLYKKFKRISNKYLPLQRFKNEDFVVIIAKSPADLIIEGETLHHCVGRMGYDQKFAREESLIFFIRNKENLNTPFVTMEYSLKENQILQCYAEHNTKPKEEVQEFINKKWLPFAKRKLKTMVA